ncbi:MAG TPA: serine hydrolase domain-containing protein [Polyangiaceae bacterium]|nr:serine hydrolase domain-containing protein [Polyangiaceae bacterium]
MNQRVFLGIVHALCTTIVLTSMGWTTLASAHDTGDLRWLDEFIPEQLERHHIPGATIAWVEEGNVRWLRGYGVADRETQRAVDERTTFRIGSVTKLFVWTALWKLIEQGVIHLDDDVDEHLCGLSTPKRFSIPIRIRDLMNHTTGLESRRRGTYTDHEEELVPLEAWLGKEMRAQIRPPGRIESYSNFGTCLAARVVECREAMSFQQYFETRISTPLGLRDSTLEQPLPPAKQATAARGYRGRGDAWVHHPFEFIRLAPAGAMSASARDMAAFMLALLGHAPHWMSATTLTSMLQTSHAPSSYLGGIAHGFFVGRRGSLRILWHGGDTRVFHSLLMLVPERGLGVFVSYNAQGGAQAYRELMSAVIDRLDRTPSATSAHWIVPSSIEGAYRSSRIAQSSYEKTEALMGDLEIRRSKNGVTAANQFWVPVAPWVFRQENGDDWLVAETGADGTVARVRRASYPMQTYERISLLEASKTHRSIAWFLFILLLTPLMWLPRGVRQTIGAGSPRRSLLIGGINSIFGMFLLGLTEYMLRQGTDPWLRDPPWTVWAIRLCLSLLTITVATGLWMVWLGWRRNWWSRWLRFHYAGMVIAGALLWTFAHHWGLSW